LATQVSRSGFAAAQCGKAQPYRRSEFFSVRLRLTARRSLGI